MDTKSANPYIGPRAFKYGEKLYGRSVEALDLLDLLIAERVVLLYSPSGAGKTSLLQADLVSELENEGFQIYPIIRVNKALPADSQTNDGNRYLYSALLSLEEERPEAEQLSDNDLAQINLHDYLTQRETALDDMAGTVLIFDQFEEILTIEPTNQAARYAFFQTVGRALRHSHRWAIFSMREDYLAELGPFLRLVPTRLNATFRLELLGADAAYQAIRQPSQDAGVNFTDDAARKLVDDLRRMQVRRQRDGLIQSKMGPTVEPVQLQVVCRRLWNEKFPPDAPLPEDASVELDDVEAAGSVDSALAAYYAEQVAIITYRTDVSQRLIRDWCGDTLIAEGGIRGQILSGPEQGLDEKAVQGLVDAHLVRAEERRGSTWYELAHDRLVKPVQDNNVAWRRKNLHLLQRRADLWSKTNRSAGWLLTGKELTEAERWAEHAELLDIEKFFLQESQQARAAAEREDSQNRRIRMLEIGIAALIIIGLAITASFFFKEARQSAITVATAETAAKVAQTIAEVAETAQATAENAATVAVIEKTVTAETASQKAEQQKPTIVAAIVAAIEDMGTAQAAATVTSQLILKDQQKAAVALEAAVIAQYEGTPNPEQKQTATAVSKTATAAVKQEETTRKEMEEVVANSLQAILPTEVSDVTAPAATPTVASTATPTPDPTETPTATSTAVSTPHPTESPTAVSTATSAPYPIETPTIASTAATTPHLTDTPTVIEATQTAISIAVSDALIQITQDENNEEWVPSFSPDQRTLVFHSNRTGKHQLFTLIPDGRHLNGDDWQQLTDDDANHFHPRFSPDGKTIAFVSDLTGNWEIYAIAPDGSNLRNLTNFPEANDIYPSFSRNGKIVFRSKREGSSGIYIMNEDGADQRRVIDTDYGETAPHISSDGRSIVYQSDASGNWDIYTIPTNGGTPKRLTTHPARDAEPVFSPDGRTIAFETKRDGNYEIYVMDADGDNLRNITQFPDANDQIPSFSPDGKWLVFQSNRNGAWDIFQVSLEKTPISALPETAGGTRITPTPTATPSATTTQAQHITPTPTATSIDTIAPVAQNCAYNYFFIPAPTPCPRYEATFSVAASQKFKKGFTIWMPELRLSESSTSTAVIFVLYENNKWALFDDMWTPDQPESDPSLEPPPGLYQPIMGFGKVWRDPTVRDKLGWALAVEQHFAGAWQQQSSGTITYLRDYDNQIIELSGKSAGDWKYITP
ncbi:MAG: hypothetical protein B6I38_01350 [Anaerolineaceae bacterium 4572_5.1]|nr:MAG: hypothetical protein B6I38_01350 [Anaerolineaceae bacterium 4572_5.1]